MTVQDQETAQGVILTDTAAAKVGSLLAQEGRDDLRLRIAVQPGGCSGLRYQLYFDEREVDGDIVSQFGTVGVVTDKMSRRTWRAPRSTSWTRSRSRASRSTTRTPRAPAPAATRSTDVVTQRAAAALIARAARRLSACPGAVMFVLC